MVLLGVLVSRAFIALHPRIKIFHGGWPRIFAKIPKKVRFEHKKAPTGLERRRPGGGFGKGSRGNARSAVSDGGWRIFLLF